MRRVWVLVFDELRLQRVSVLIGFEQILDGSVGLYLQWAPVPCLEFRVTVAPKPKPHN